MKSVQQDLYDLSPEENLRYARQISLSEIGLAGQKKLKSSSILCIGTGGLGSPALLYLAAAGVGRLGIVDCDLVESSNLQRQIIHNNSNLGKSKTLSAKEQILSLNPLCNVETFETLITKDNAIEILSKFDIVCDCTDNFPSRFLINDACVILGKTNIYGSIARFEGQASVFNLTPESPNLRDLYPEIPRSEIIPSCSADGVIGVLPGLIGVIQATEAIKIITGIGTNLSGRLLVYDALKMDFRQLNLQISSIRRKISSLDEFDYALPINQKYSDSDLGTIPVVKVKELRDMMLLDEENFLLIDVRNKEENKEYSIEHSLSIPLHTLDQLDVVQSLKNIALERKVYVFCQKGGRSIKAIEILKKYGINGINVDGGIEAWKNLLDNK